jgi:hypothetical protein
LVLRLCGAKIKLLDDTSAPRGEIEHLYCSGHLSKVLLDGWAPLVTLEQGLQRTIVAAYTE